MAIRNRNGSYLVDAPVTLWILFFLFIFPLLDLATISLRVYFFRTVANQAMRAAVRSQTLVTNMSSSELSAKNAATKAADDTLKGFSGVRLTQPIELEVMKSPLSNPNNLSVIWNSSGSSSPLTTLPDSSQNIVLLQVNITGEVDPLVTLQLPFFKDPIPGLTAPINLKMSAQGRFENVSGLSS